MTAKGKRKKSNGEMSFLQHLEELRWHILRSLVAVVAGAILAFLFKNIIFDKIILAPNTPEFLTNRLLCRLADLVNVPALCINQYPVELISIKLAGQFTTHITISLVAGLIIAFPYILHEFWLFFKPALYEKERQYARGAVTYSSLLFLTGILFGYFAIAPLTINFLGSYRVSQLVTNQINITSYIGSVTSVTLASGVAFELPIVVFFLAQIGVLTAAFMRKYRRHSLVVILIVAAIITPPDVFSQILVVIPLILLYEISIFIAVRVEKRQSEANQAHSGEERTSGRENKGDKESDNAKTQGDRESGTSAETRGDDEENTGTENKGNRESGASAETRGDDEENTGTENKGDRESGTSAETRGDDEESTGTENKGDRESDNGEKLK